MAEFEDYQLEEAEDAAVKNIQMAKRAGIGAAAAAVAGGAAFAATKLSGEDASNEELDSADILNGTESGVVTNEVITETVEAPVVEDAAAETPVVNEESENKEEVAPADDEDGVKFETSDYYYDEDGNLLASVDKGTVNGHEFTMIDQDGDGMADILAIDENGDNIYQDDEIHEVSEEGIAMGNAANKTEHYVEEDNEHGGAQGSAGEDEIPNDYDNHNSEEYRGDIAEDNPDYKNDAFEELDANDEPAAEVEEEVEEIIEPVEEPVAEPVVEEPETGDFIDYIPEVEETDELVVEDESAEPLEEEYGYDTVGEDDQAYVDDANTDDVDLI